MNGISIGILALTVNFIFSVTVSAAITQSPTDRSLPGKPGRYRTVEYDRADPSTQRMIKALKSRDPFARAYAAQVLGEIADSRALEPLVDLLQDENLYVRAYTAEALGKQGGLS